MYALATVATGIMEGVWHDFEAAIRTQAWGVAGQELGSAEQGPDLDTQLPAANLKSTLHTPAVAGALRHSVRTSLRLLRHQRICFSLAACEPAVS